MAEWGKGIAAAALAIAGVCVLAYVESIRPPQGTAPARPAAATAATPAPADMRPGDTTSDDTTSGDTYSGATNRAGASPPGASPAAPSTAAVPATSGRAATGPYANWAAIVVAGDHEDSSGRPSQGFDNARRDVSRDLLTIGFAPDNLVEFSVKPKAYRREKLLPTRPGAIERTLNTLAQRTRGGCLIYFSSHGSPDGLIVGDWIMPPRALSRIVDESCGQRPTVVVISSCFSGAMLPPLEGANRLVLTAARRDRTSFGCGQTDRYPYFDACILQSFGGVRTFPDLGERARACVAARERRERVTPHSEPQIWVGPKVTASLPAWK